MSSELRPLAGAEPPTVSGVSAPRWFHHPQLPAYAAIALAIFVRATHVLSADFPLNDGGLFYRMIQEIQAAHYRLPAFTTYNNASIPFAYSPFALYLTAAINDLTGISLLQLFRFLPLFANALLVVAFYRLARALLRDETTAAVAVLAFAVMPRSFVWLIMGGGLTRSFGLLFAVIAIEQVYQLYTRREWRYAITSSVACALTVLTHLSTASFLAFSIALFFVFYGRHRRGLIGSAAVAVATILLTAPWWGMVVAQHGLAPFRAAQTVSGSVFADAKIRYDVLLRLARFNLGLGGEPFFPLVSVLAVIGGFAALRPDRFILPVWWVLIVALDARGGVNYAPVPATMLAAIGVVYVLIPALRSAYGAGNPLRPRPSTLRTVAAVRTPSVAPLLRFVPVLVLGFLLAYGIGTALTRNSDYGGEAHTLTALTPADRDAMRWVAQHTPPASRFLVVTGVLWPTDKIAEWFPALTHRSSVSTLQGQEWLPGFTRRVKENDQALQFRCRGADGRCLAAWVDSTGRPFTYVYIPKAKDSTEACCRPLIKALRRDSSYAMVYDGPGAFIAERH